MALDRSGQPGLHYGEDGDRGNHGEASGGGHGWKGEKKELGRLSFSPSLPPFFALFHYVSLSVATRRKRRSALREIFKKSVPLLAKKKNALFREKKTREKLRQKKWSHSSPTTEFTGKKTLALCIILLLSSSFQSSASLSDPSDPVERRLRASLSDPGDKRKGSEALLG